MRKRISLNQRWILNLPESQTIIDLPWKIQNKDLPACFSMEKNIVIPEECADRLIYLCFDLIDADISVEINGMEATCFEDEFCEKFVALSKKIGNEFKLKICFRNGRFLLSGINLLLLDEIHLPQSVHPMFVKEYGLLKLFHDDINIPGFHCSFTLTDSKKKEIHPEEIQNWSCETPNLYLLTTRLLDEENHVIDEIKEQISYCELTSNDKGILLNGLPISMVGCHYTCDKERCREEDFKNDFFLMKKAGFNCLFLDGNAPKLFFRLCDEYGFIVLSFNIISNHVCCTNSKKITETILGNKAKTGIKNSSSFASVLHVPSNSANGFDYYFNALSEFNTQHKSTLLLPCFFDSPDHSCGLISHDRKTVKESYYLFQSYFSSVPFIHIYRKSIVYKSFSHKLYFKVLTNGSSFDVYLNGKKIIPIEKHALVYEISIKLTQDKNEICVKYSKYKDGFCHDRRDGSIH